MNSRLELWCATTAKSGALDSGPDGAGEYRNFYFHKSSRIGEFPILRNWLISQLKTRII